MEEPLLLLLLIIANGSPIVSRMLLGQRFASPVDGGMTLADGYRLFGSSKTWRGIVTSIVTTIPFALLFGFSWQLGLAVATLTMVGDLISSFVKRRQGLSSGAMRAGLDHLPEAILPLLACKPLLGLSWLSIILVAVGFMLADIVISRLFYRLGFHDHPH